MDMIKLLLMVIIPLTLYIESTSADHEHQNLIKTDSQLDLITELQQDVNNNNGAPGERYSRHVYHKKLIKLKPRQFSRYGPPRYPSASQFKRPSPQVFNEHLNSWSHQHHPNDGTPEKIQGVKNNNDQEQYRLLNVPSPIRNHDFKDHDPIANQNNEPFNHNLANYLPPKNQQLPGFTPFHVFQSQQPTHLPSDQSPNLNNPFKTINTDYKTSDATFFLLKNAESLSKLYKTPVMNLNYPPYDDQSLNESFKKFGSTGEQSRLDYPLKIQPHRSEMKSMSQFQTSALRNSPRLQSKCNNHDALKLVKSTPDVSIPATAPTSYIHQGNSPTTVYPYPQYNGLFPLFGTSFNLGNNIPSYGVSAGSSSIYPTPASGDSSSTHFGLPFPGGREDITPVAVRPGTYSHVPGFSIIPAGTSIQDYPVYPGDYISS